MNMFADGVDAGCCPLCGGANVCAAELERSTGQAQPPCWCTLMRIDPDVRARVPLAARGRACICPGCAAGVAEVA